MIRPEPCRSEIGLAHCDDSTASRRRKSKIQDSLSPKISFNESHRSVLSLFSIILLLQYQILSNSQPWPPLLPRTDHVLGEGIPFRSRAPKLLPWITKPL